MSPFFVFFQKLKKRPLFAIGLVIVVILCCILIFGFHDDIIELFAIGLPIIIGFVTAYGCHALTNKIFPNKQSGWIKVVIYLCLSIIFALIFIGSLILFSREWYVMIKNLIGSHYAFDNLRQILDQNKGSFITNLSHSVENGINVFYLSFSNGHMIKLPSGIGWLFLIVLNCGAHFHQVFDVNAILGLFNSFFSKIFNQQNWVMIGAAVVPIVIKLFVIVGISWVIGIYLLLRQNRLSSMINSRYGQTIGASKNFKIFNSVVGKWLLGVVVEMVFLFIMIWIVVLLATTIGHSETIKPLEWFFPLMFVFFCIFPFFGNLFSFLILLIFCAGDWGIFNNIYPLIIVMIGVIATLLFHGFVVCPYVYKKTLTLPFFIVICGAGLLFVFFGAVGMIFTYPLFGFIKVKWFSGLKNNQNNHQSNKPPLNNSQPKASPTTDKNLNL